MVGLFPEKPREWGLLTFRLDFHPKTYNSMVVDNLSATFSALSDPTRRMIVERLTRGPATVNEIAEPFAISQQAISKHLAYLERAKLIEKHRDGRQHFCKLRPDAIRAVAGWAEGYRRFWEESYQRLDSLLEEMRSAERRSEVAKTKTIRKEKKKHD
jgi:DNA-binding transcriptional ArsR family regulator